MKINIKLCKCGCGQPVTKEGNIFLNGHYFKWWKEQDPKGFIKHQREAGKKGGTVTQKLYPNLSSKIMKKSLREWKEQDPEGYKTHFSKAGKKCHKLHPNLSHENGLKTQRLHPNDNIGKRIKEWKKRDPEGFIKHQREAGRLGGKKVHELYPSIVNNLKKYTSIGTKASHKARRNNKPYIWKGIHFDSKEEMEVAKLILTVPIEGVNCHISVGNKVVDFFPQKNDKIFQEIMVEYHPWDFDGRSTEEYKKERKEAVNNSKYKGTPLVVITQINDLKP